ncbi:MAG TPA: SRPBCC family protein [Micromonosporaceae bacterium]|nr:SRPBCC family protein [Micromonosporaceae bacterium]
MPNVVTENRSDADAAFVWEALKDIESFPSYMDVVRDIKIDEWSGERRVSSWSVMLKGSILEWQEEELIDEATRTITFRQLEGDLAYFNGHWAVGEQDGLTVLRLEVDFDIGIPLLAEMLNPVAALALEDNSTAILEHLQQRARR